MSDESVWIERAQSAEARIKTLEDQYRPMKERVQAFKANFGVKERSDGSIVVDFEKFVANLPLEQALELRAVIDEHHRISGAPGEKPKVRLSVSVNG